ncbi:MULTISPECIES: DNA polymerase III subunit beta [unclassified Devosia]|uniref:DNA polymerase III subunit beta n=1 Tax=unclassified Devosia TaxID=196773 RepID=UPI001AD41447|nr:MULTISPECIES: DNA polymerase III subunit beta [unclassified Devosia]MBN9304088.1 DNA polymerase III subunit beta [Devosia sp.]
MMDERYVRIDGTQLSEALQLCTYVVEKRNTYPILAMVKLDYHDAVLTLTATDLDIDLSVVCAPIGCGTADWTICLPAHPLASIARLAGSNGVVIRPNPSDATKVQVSLDQGDLFQEVSYDIDGLASDSFPDIRGKRGELIEIFGNGRMAELLRRVSWAMSTEETRYYLNGVAWQVGGPLGRRLAATDGHRLALCSYDPIDTAGQQLTRILPIKLVGLLERLPMPNLNVFDVLSDAPGRAGLNAIEIDAGKVTIRAKLVEGTYPDIDRVIPKPSNHVARFELPADRLAGAVDRALVLAESTKGGKMISFSRDEATGLIAVANMTLDYGASKVVTPFAWPEGGVTFGANGRYLRDVLKSCAGKLQIKQIDAAAPITILDEDGTMVRLLMPMRV